MLKPHLLSDHARWLAPVLAFIRRLLDPRVPVTQEIEQVRLASLFALLGAFTFTVSASWAWMPDIIRQCLLISALTMAIGYVVNKYGWYMPAALLVAGALCYAPFSGLWYGDQIEGSTVMFWLAWLGPTLFVAYLVLNLYGTLFIAGSAIGLVVLLPQINPAITLDEVLLPLMYVLVVALNVVIAAVWREIVVNQKRNHAVQVDYEQARYRELFEATFEAIIVHHDGVILDVNPAMETKFGYPRDEIIGRSTLDFIAPEYRPLAREKYASGAMEPYEIRCVRKDGSQFWVEVRGKPHRYRGKPVRVAAVRNIDARKRAEQDRIDLAIQREKVAILQRFIGDMSHDLRTPLSVIKTSGYLIEKLATSGQSERMMRQIEVLHDQSNQLQRMLDDLLHMSRLDKADTSSYEFEWHAVLPFIEGVIADVREAGLRKSQQIVFAADAALPKIVVDQNEFKRMIRHLLNNAISYTPEGGTISVRVKPAPGWVVIEVSDTGEGIAPLNLPHIFERFYRGDAARGSDSGGTGLGLAIAKKIVEAHNGHIEAESELGKGSTFRIRLPAPKDGTSKENTLVPPVSRNLVPSSTT
jgi:PAS domain S-box-containing protein